MLDLQKEKYFLHYYILTSYNLSLKECFFLHAYTLLYMHVIYMWERRGVLACQVGVAPIMFMINCVVTWMRSRRECLVLRMTPTQ